MTSAHRREYRRMMRRLHELDRADAGTAPRRLNVRTAAVRLLAVGLGIVLVATFALSVAHKIWGLTVTPDGVWLPRPLGEPPVVTTGVGDFKFMQVQPGDPSRPVAYDPCRPIEYQVNDSLAPPGANAILDGAVSRISRATGLQFEYAGTTDRLLDDESAPSRARRAPVLLVWTTPRAVPRLEGRSAGIGGSTARLHHFSGDLEYVSGEVVLDAPALREVIARPNGVAQVEAILVHELAHVVGLGHVDNPNELMHEDNAGRLDLGPGDREGLALLGSGRCYH